MSSYSAFLIRYAQVVLDQDSGDFLKEGLLQGPG